MSYAMYSSTIDANIDNFMHLPFAYTYHLDEQNNRIQSPRKMCWFAENATWYYKFSRSHIEPLWPYTFAEYPIINRIKQEVERLTDFTFNCCLVNIYTDGNEYADWHDDNEPWLGHNPRIASVSIGATRNLEIRCKNTKTITMIPLKNNDILMMNQEFQSQFQHRLPIDNDCKDIRINLTFRKIIPSLIDHQHSEQLKLYWHS